MESFTIRINKRLIRQKNDYGGAFRGFGGSDGDGRGRGHFTADRHGDPDWFPVRIAGQVESAHDERDLVAFLDRDRAGTFDLLDLARFDFDSSFRHFSISFRVEIFFGKGNFIAALPSLANKFRTKFSVARSVGPNSAMTRFKFGFLDSDSAKLVFYPVSNRFLFSEIGS